MLNMIIVDADRAERQQLLNHIQRCCAQKDLLAQAAFCADWPELFAHVKEHDPDIVIVAQNGVAGLDTITSAKLLTGRIIWFSDLDFGVQAYRLCVAYFCQKPITYPKVERALTRCLAPTAPPPKEDTPDADL